MWLWMLMTMMTMLTMLTMLVIMTVKMRVYRISANSFIKNFARHLSPSSGCLIDYEFGQKLAFLFAA